MKRCQKCKKPFDKLDRYRIYYIVGSCTHNRITEERSIYLDLCEPCEKRLTVNLQTKLVEAMKEAFTL